jgi:hypothetical protein
VAEVEAQTAPEQKSEQQPQQPWPPSKVFVELHRRMQRLLLDVRCHLTGRWLPSAKKYGMHCLVSLGLVRAYHLLSLCLLLSSAVFLCVCLCVRASEGAVLTTLKNRRASLIRLYPLGLLPTRSVWSHVVNCGARTCAIFQNDDVTRKTKWGEKETPDAFHNILEGRNSKQTRKHWPDLDHKANNPPPQ